MGRFAVWWRGLWRGWPIEVTSSFSVEAAETALRGALSRRATWFVDDPTGRLGPRVVAGRVSEGGEIRMIASSTSGQNGWRRTLRARVLALPGGCVVTGVLLPNALGQGLTLLWLAASGLLAAIGIGAAAWHAALRDWSTVPPTIGAIGAGVGIALWGLFVTALENDRARRDEEFLRAWLANLLA